VIWPMSLASNQVRFTSGASKSSIRPKKAFGRLGSPRGKEKTKEAKIAQLEEKITTKNEVFAELMEENVKAKKPMGDFERMLAFFNKRAHDTRDEIIDYIKYWKDHAELPAKRLLRSD